MTNIVDALKAILAKNQDAARNAVTDENALKEFRKLNLAHIDLRHDLNDLLNQLDAPPEAWPPDLVLADMAGTYKARNAVYGDNWKTVGEVMMSLFPNGIRLGTAADFNRWHLFELIVVKLTRFANSGLAHRDSIHDIAVYGAMIESILLADPKAAPIRRKD